MASSGLDLAIVAGGFTAIGWWLDRHYGWYPWGTLIGALVGIVGGLTNFLREALAAGQSSKPTRWDGERRDSNDS